MHRTDIPINEKVDNAVKKYCDTIVSYIKEMHPTVSFEVDYEEALNDKETERASIVDIQTEHAFVTIFPDFAKKSAKAALLNRGLITAMEVEGFDDDTINNSDVYGTLMPFTIENAETFAVVLTQDLGLQHQKLLLE